MTRHPHLSIGEVLSRLAEEFPDVTISKIRFLESQGLIEPERTPSGYRRFYPPDLNRLRWVLAQQRDHFLPLKVIKDRLDAGFVPPESWEAAPAASAPKAMSLTVSKPPGEPSGNGLGPVAGEPALIPSAPVVGELHGEQLDASIPANAGRSEGINLAQPSDEFASWTPPRLSRSGRKGPSTTGQAPKETPVSAPASRPSADLSSVSLNLTEFATTVGLDVAVVRDLERYGLIVGHQVGPDVLYGDDALITARLAARFAAFGVEPRHLRSFRVAADRELALYEQVVTPLFRQRNHSSAGVAVDTLSELSELGEQLRRALLSRSCREYLGTD